jgi:hypothetical protein
LKDKNKRDNIQRRLVVVLNSGADNCTSERKRNLQMTQSTTSSGNANATSQAVESDVKAKKTRTVDYSRTDKRPHSFRYKRHSTFVARSEAVSLSKDLDGAFVIGPAPEGSTADAGTLQEGQLELISVKKRPNGKTAITFKHAELGDVLCYDSRAARASLRAG